MEIEIVEEQVDKERMADLLMNAEWRTKKGERQWVLTHEAYRELMQMCGWTIKELPDGDPLASC